MVLVCAARSATDRRNGWLNEYNEARRHWSRAAGRTNYRPDLTAVLASTRFRTGEPITVEGSHELSARDLAYRMLTFWRPSPAVLADKVNAMLHDVEQRLLPFTHAGSLTEVVIANADVAIMPAL